MPKRKQDRVMTIVSLRVRSRELFAKATALKERAEREQKSLSTQDNQKVEELIKTITEMN